MLLSCIGGRDIGVSLPSWSLPPGRVAPVNIAPSDPVSDVIVVAIKPTEQNEAWDKGDKRARPHLGCGVRPFCDICGRPERWLMIRWRGAEAQREGAKELFRKRKQSLWIVRSGEQLFQVMKRRSVQLEHRGAGWETCCAAKERHRGSWSSTSRHHIFWIFCFSSQWLEHSRIELKRAKSFLS